MPTTNALIVPIRLEAMQIGLNDSLYNNYFLPSYADFSRIPPKSLQQGIAYLGQTVLNQPLTGNYTMPQGIHLHWQLPKALRKAVTDSNGKMYVPDAPDRWLVTRVMVDSAVTDQTSVTLNSWVIESNYVFDTDQYSSVSVPNDVSLQPNNPYSFIGRLYTLADWFTEGGKGTYAPGLNALGYGIPDFSSYYPNCKNVFGMLDDSMNDNTLPDTTIGYIVVGWYSELTSDPASQQVLNGQQNDLGWLFNQGESVSPDYSLYIGCTHNLIWNPNKTYFPSYKDPLSPNIGIGNSTMEALSVIVANTVKNIGSESIIESLLNAFQLGLMKELGNTSGLAAIEDEMFRQSFTGTDGGILWEIKSTQESSVKKVSKDRNNSKKLLASLPENIATELNQLNLYQMQLTAAINQGISLQQQLFIDWNKFMNIEYAAPDPVYPDENKTFQFLNDEVTAIASIQGQNGTIETFTQNVQQQRSLIESQLPEGLSLVSMAAPRYYTPNDPVIVLSGDGVNLSPADNDSTIECVLSDQLVNGLNLAAGLVTESEAVSLLCSALVSPDPNNQLPNPVLAQIVQASLIVNSDAAGYLCSVIAGLGVPTNNPAVLDFAATETAILFAQNEYLAGSVPAGPVSFPGPFPQADVCMTDWVSPWNPIALQWNYHYLPVLAVNDTVTTYPADFITANFNFDDSSFNYEYASEKVSPFIQSFTGGNLLSSDADTTIQEQIAAYLLYNQDAELEQIQTQLGNTPWLSQSLGGFYAGMNMQAATMQLPVQDPLSKNQAYFYFAQNTVNPVVNDQNTISPMPNNCYNPVQAGKVSMQKMVLVNQFGMYKTLDLEKMLVSQSITAVANPFSAPDLFFAPRINQDARVDFRLLAAGDNAVTVSNIPSTTPVCGWLVPNHLDGSLMFYDGNGSAIGAIIPIKNNTEVYWQSSPGKGPVSGSGFADSFAGMNAVLTAFASNIYYTLGAPYLIEMIKTFDRSKIFINPAAAQDDDTTAVLIGAPLALVQASIDATLMGMPAPNQSYDALKKDIAQGNVLQRTTADFTGIQFPLLLGNQSDMNDGLIGYYLQQQTNGAWETDFTTFYSAAADGQDANIVVPSSTNIQLTLGTASSPRQITMIIDPRCEVHAYTGVLPVVSLSIQPDILETAIGNMNFTFLVTPILWPGEQISMPLPEEGDGNWNWVCVFQQQWQSSSVGPINEQATLQPPVAISEGWLQLSPKTTGQTDFPFHTKSINNQ